MKPNDPKVLMCAIACELSYLDFHSKAFHEGNVAIGFPNTATIENAGIEAYVAWNAEEMIVCFRGTDSGADWLADAMAGKTPFIKTEMQVHTGFMRTLLVIESMLNDHIRRESNGKKIYVTGHSLGAAMATLFAMRMNSSIIHAVVTFGSPRVGNEAFTALFNKTFGDNSLRFVNNNDMVTRVPWKAMKYSHVHHQHYFDRAGKLHPRYRPNPMLKFWNALSGRVRNLSRLKIGDGISDHSIHDYRRLVEKNQ